LLIYLPLF